MWFDTDHASRAACCGFSRRAAAQASRAAPMVRSATEEAHEVVGRAAVVVVVVVKVDICVLLVVVVTVMVEAVCCRYLWVAPGSEAAVGLGVSAGAGAGAAGEGRLEEEGEGGLEDSSCRRCCSNS